MTQGLKSFCSMWLKTIVFYSTALSIIAYFYIRDVPAPFQLPWQETVQEAVLYSISISIFCMVILTGILHFFGLELTKKGGFFVTFIENFFLSTIAALSFSLTIITGKPVVQERLYDMAAIERYVSERNEALKKCMLASRITISSELESLVMTRQNLTVELAKIAEGHARQAHALLPEGTQVKSEQLTQACQDDAGQFFAIFTRILTDNLPQGMELPKHLR